jgi:hypothetical protein
MDPFPYNRWVSLIFFTVAVTNASIFFGWLRLRTGDVWSASIAHGANNMTEDKWHRVAFTGESSGKPSLASDAVLILAEVVVLTGIVVVDTMRRRVWTARSQGERGEMSPQHNADGTGTLSPKMQRKLEEDMRYETQRGQFP